MNNQENLQKDEIISLVSVFTGTIIVFFIIYEIIYWVYERKARNLQNEIDEGIALLEYKRWTNEKKADFISRITSQIHAFIGIVVAIRALFFTCVDPSNKEHYSNFFVSDYCLMEHFDLFQMITLCITSGYLIFDIYICYARIQEKSKLQTQTYIHHAVGISGALAAMFYGRGGALIISNVLLINEFSTFFLNYRQFLLIFKKHESSLYSINAICFFFSFLFSRIIFNSIVSIWVGRAFYLTVKDKGILACPWWQIILGFYLIGLFFVINILNIIWFMGILKHVKRNLGGGSHSNQQSNTELQNALPNERDSDFIRQNEEAKNENQRIKRGEGNGPKNYEGTSDQKSDTMKIKKREVPKDQILQ